MAGWRTYLRGHTRVLAAFSASLPWLRRPPVALGALLAIGLAGVLVNSCVSRTEASDPKRERAPLDMQADAPQTMATPLPTLLNDAVAKAYDTTQEALPLAHQAAPAGLQVRALSDQTLQAVLPQLGRAEARLIDIYRLIAKGQQRAALTQAEALVRDHPNFHLAHLVHGDLLSLQVRPVRQIGDVPNAALPGPAITQLNVLREESRRRLRALTERPPEGSVPTQFLTLSSQSRHAIAVDASRSRLYLFENLSAPGHTGAPRLKLLGDYYISVGLQGIEKQSEGDKRTPLGVYYITSSLKTDNLPDLYGVGALPINYPNPLDVQRGKTGSGIWLHGTPREQFVRAPQASDGCVVLSNPDLERLLGTVQVRTTPVVIAPALQWVQPQALDTSRQHFEATLKAWREAKSQGNLQRLKGFYSDRFQHQGRDLSQWWPKVEGEVRDINGTRGIELKDLSLLQWRDQQDTMVVTFGEVASGQSRGITKRQYWALERDQWKIFFEGTP
jgi:murein L,D-transpeptidase YafK